MLDRPRSRRRLPPSRFDPTPTTSQQIHAVLAGNPALAASEVTAEAGRAAVKARRAERAAAQAAAAKAAEEAERSLALLEAVTPRPLPFSLPPLQRREPAPLMITYSDPAAPASGPRKRRYQLMTAAEERLAPLMLDEVDACSEFSGIGGLEHGLQAGFAEAGLGFRLLQASELVSTSTGAHATAILHKRFNECVVLDPQLRARFPYPESADILTVTPVCTEHSGLNANGDPTKTEAMLHRVLDRIACAPQLQCIVLENVPNFVSALDRVSPCGKWRDEQERPMHAPQPCCCCRICHLPYVQERSSYSMWADELGTLGIRYVLSTNSRCDAQAHDDAQRHRDALWHHRLRRDCREGV